MGEVSIRYSEAFKRQVVSELACGHLASHAEARRRYGIGGAETIARWVDKYGPDHMKRRIVRVETPDERSRIEALESRIRDLERAVVDSKVQESLHKAYFDIVCRETGVTDPVSLKKNIAAKLSAERSEGARGR